MDSELYRAAIQGNVQFLKYVIQNNPMVLDSEPPQGNTALHIAAKHGHKDFAETILKERNALLIKKNAEEDTPLHIAARFGRLDAVELLINYASGWRIFKPLRMTNMLQNTALHEAVKQGNSAIAMKLLSAEPSAGYMENADGETPLHIAARVGLRDVVSEILQYMPVELTKEQRTALYQAVLNGHSSIMEILLKERSDCIEFVDELGDNALHYAARKNNGKMVEMLFRRKPSLAYVNNNDGQYPLHVAAASGSNVAIKELLKQCPDAAEQVDFSGMNAIHIAVMSGMVIALECLLKHIKSEEIVNQTDDHGNTPLHLAAKNLRFHSSRLLLTDKRVNPCIIHKEGLTASGICPLTEEMDTYERYILESLKKSEERKCKKHHQLSEAATTPRLSSRKKKSSDKHFKSCVQTYTFVAALVATVTFAATFTMPGGFDQIYGYAILTEHVAFKIFVICNTIAMCSSLIVMFCFIWAWTDPARFKLNQLTWGHRLTVVASLAMIVAVTAAVYVVVAKHCLWLAIVVCLICGSTPFILWVLLGRDILFIPV